MNSDNILSRAEEDFVEAIYILYLDQNYVRSIDVATYLKLTRATVSRTLKNLESSGLIIRNRNSTLQLSDKGNDIARYIYDKHCFFKNWLLKADVDEKTAEKESSALGHNICSDTFEKLKKACI